MPKNHNTQVDKMHYGAELVRRIGDATFYNSLSLRDFFVIDGIKLWEIVEPTLAAFEISRAFDADYQTVERVNYYLRSKLINLKYRNIRRRELNLAKSQTPNMCTNIDRLDILLYGFSGYMIRDVINPLACKISETKHSYRILTDNKTITTATGLNNSDCNINIWSMWNDECDAELEKIRNRYKTLAKHLDHKKIGNLYKICDMPCSYIVFNAFITYVFDALIPYYFNHLIIASRLFKSVNVIWNISPDVSDPKVRAFCLVGRKHNIKWADVQFAIYNHESVEWAFCQSDIVFVWGEYNHKLLKDFGIQSDIQISGSPKFDSIFKEVRNKSKEKQIESEKINVLFCSMYALKAYSNIPGFKEALKSVKGDIVKFAKLNPKISLTIKLHPLENSCDIKQFVGNDTNVRIVKGTSDIREYIKACDIFITLGSTSTIDAILQDKVIIYPNYDQLVWWDDMYLKSEVVLQASTPALLKQTLLNTNLLLSTENLDQMRTARDKFIVEWIGNSDQESSERIVRALGLDTEK